MSKLKIPQRGDRIILAQQLRREVIAYVGEVFEYDTDRKAFEVTIHLDKTSLGRLWISWNTSTLNIANNQVWHLADMETPLCAEAKRS